MKATSTGRPNDAEALASRSTRITSSAGQRDERRQELDRGFARRRRRRVDEPEVDDRDGRDLRVVDLGEGRPDGASDGTAVAADRAAVAITTSRRPPIAADHRELGVESRGTASEWPRPAVARIAGRGQASAARGRRTSARCSARQRASIAAIGSASDPVPDEGRPRRGAARAPSPASGPSSSSAATQPVARLALARRRAARASRRRASGGSAPRGGSWRRARAAARTTSRERRRAAPRRRCRRGSAGRSSAPSRRGGWSSSRAWR